MKYIALEKQCAKEIAEQGMNYSGRLKGILSSDIRAVEIGTEDKYTRLESGCLFDILLDSGEVGQLTFKLKNPWNSKSFPVVLALPIKDQQVKLIGNNAIEFDFDCTNDLWKIIIENYRKRTIARIEEELGIDVSDVLTVEPIIINYSISEESIYNVDKELMERITARQLGDKFYILNRVVIDKEHRHLLSEMYERRVHLFKPKMLEGCEVESINLIENDNNIILELSGFFGPTEQIPLTKTKGLNNDQ